MGAVNRFPQGLLGLLQSQSTGQTTTESEDKLRLSLDMLPFYLAGTALKSANAVESVSARGTASQVDVPAGQTWLIVSVASTVTYVSNNDAVRCYPQLSGVPAIPGSVALPGAPVEIPLDRAEDSFAATISSAGDRVTFVWSPPSPLIVRAPIGFSTYIARLTVTSTLSVETGVAFYQLDL
jgi:hypothetical protein